MQLEHQALLGKPEEGEATGCRQWLHAEYKVYTSHTPQAHRRLEASN